MESTPVDLNEQESDSSLASKATKPSPKQNASTPVDDDGKVNEEKKKCEHFSIRGYVAEIRKRDPTLCDPFSFLVRGDKPKETRHDELPPMEVPEFRWWKCDGCIPGTAGTSSGTDLNNEVQKSVNETVTPIQPTEQTPKVDARRERNTDASTSTDSNDNRNDAPSNNAAICALVKGKGKAHAEEELPPQTGCESGLLKDASTQGTLQLTAGEITASRSVDDEVVVRSRSTENVNSKSHQKNCRKANGIAIGPSNKKHSNHEDDSSKQTPPKKARLRLEAQCADAGTSHAGMEIAGIVYSPAIEGRNRVVSLPDLNEVNGESVDNDDLVAASGGNNNAFEEDDDYLGTDRRKTPKVRLLSELLGLRESQGDCKLKKKHTSYSSFPGPAARRSMVVFDPQITSVTNENNAKRKRVGSQDEESKSFEIKGLSNVTKKPRTPQVEVSEIESEDESTEIISEAVTKRRNMSTLDKNPLLERKNKKIKFDSGVSSSMSHPKIIPKSSQEKGKSVEKHVCAYDAPITNPLHVGHSDRLVDQIREVDSQNLGLNNKRKGKMSQSGKESRDNSAIEKSKLGMHKGGERVLHELGHMGSIRKGTYNFSEGRMTVGDDQISIPPVKNRLYHRPSPVEHTPLDGGLARKHTENINFGVNNLGVRAPSAGGIVGSIFDVNVERNSDPKSNLKGKHVCILESDGGGSVVHHLPKQVSESVITPKELTNEVRGRIQDIDINSIPTDDKVAEEGTADDNHDIPMDIVELMAKNQYERNLSDPKDMPHPVPPANLEKTVRSNENNRTYGENMSTSKQPFFLSMQKSVPTEARNIASNGFDEVGSSRQKIFGQYSDFNQTHVITRGHVSENQVPARSASSAHRHELVPTYSNLGLTQNYWNRQVPPQRCPPSFLQAVNTCNRYMAPSTRPNIDTHVWPPSIVGRRMPMPMSIGISSPERISHSSNSLHKEKMHHQGPNMLNFSAVNIGKQNMSFANHSYNSGSVESSNVSGRPASKHKGADYPPKTMGSPDLYSNPAIPAMDLLSLMQNAATLQPPAPLTSNGKADQLLKRPSNLSVLESGQLNMGSTSISSTQPLLENNCRKSSMQENSCHPCYPARSFAPSFQNGGGFGRNPGFVSPIPLTSRGQRNMESSHFVAQGVDHHHRPQKWSTTTTCEAASRERPLVSATDKGKGIATMSKPSSTTNHFSGSRNPPPYIHGMATKRNEKANCPKPDTEICVVNRNPSELNDLRELNKYIIKPEDLRPQGVPREKQGKPRSGDVKRQQMRMKMNKPMPSSKDRER